MNQTFKNLLAASIVLAILFVAWGIETLRDSRPGLFARLCLWTVGVAIVALALLLGMHFARAHDHSRAELDGWFTTLKSSKGPCCDRTDTMHLAEIDWVTQNKPGSHFRVKVPATKEGFAAAMEGGDVAEMTWIDVPDDALVEEPNKAGHALVWPLYGYGGLTIRCFMPGSMT